ncbi:MAG: VWA domain-containing protein [Acidobacteriia bacterium]|nr:VWA domain-containing protein [Terriglobia bacterium]
MTGGCVRGVIAVCVFGWSALAQPAPSFRADTTLVLVPVTVTDPSNRYVLGLSKENFHLFEDGVEQKITSFSTEDAPLSVGLIVDVSGSMGLKLHLSSGAAGQFLKTMNSSDEAFLVEFSDQAEVVLPFTHQMNRIEQKIGALSTGGLTAMLDGIHISLDEMKKASNPRKALLIISDGGDNHSRYTSKQIEELVRQADTQIFAMGVFDTLGPFGLSFAEMDGPRLLSELAEQTGGRALAATSDRDLPTIASRIGVELRNQYVLAYSSTNTVRDGKYRHLELKLDQPPAFPKLSARWRLGYYAPND